MTTDSNLQLNSGHRRHFQRMRHAGAKEVAFMVEKHLGFVYQPPKGGKMYGVVLVLLEIGSSQCLGLIKPPTTSVQRIAGIER